jgi:hypothetical protein
MRHHEKDMYNKLLLIKKGWETGQTGPLQYAFPTFKYSLHLGANNPKIRK